MRKLYFGSWTLAIHCDETYEVKAQPGNNSIQNGIFKTFCVLYRVVGHLGGRLVERWLLVADRFASLILIANSWISRVPTYRLKPPRKGFLQDFAADMKENIHDRKASPHSALQAILIYGR